MLSEFYAGFTSEAFGAEEGSRFEVEPFVPFVAKRGELNSGAINCLLLVITPSTTTIP